MFRYKFTQTLAGHTVLFSSKSQEIQLRKKGVLFPSWLYKVTTSYYTLFLTVFYFHIPGNVPTLNELLLIKFSDGNALRIMEVVAQFGKGLLFQ